MKHKQLSRMAVELLVGIWTMLGAGQWAANPAETPAVKPHPEKIRVLVTYGGHGFDEKEFWALFDAMPDVEWDKAELPKQADLLQPGLETKYDVLVMYDMCPKFTPQQQQAFVQLLRQGIGIVSLHHNLAAHFDWDEFRKIIGGRFILRNCQIDGKEYKQSPVSHGETIRVLVADKNHPITQGVEDFDIKDETYGPFYVAEGVHVLLRTEHPKNNPVIGWTWKYEKSPVFYLMLGHDRFAYEHSAFQKLLGQGIRWAASQRIPKK
ncbi:MAG: ThuA domain-containing protein [Thermoguttaceae bacterium]|nr:ThuA domain-containing protein [Thermoguttaceae bacterium]MDW8036851.1 ThuA domain-containing protein [Thermoguttaceae bacterium]